MIQIIEMFIAIIGIVVVLLIVNVIFWVSYNDGKTPNINDDYYKLKNEGDNKEPKKENEV